MLEFLANVGSTTIEGICIFVLTLNLFRFKAREHIVAIGIANLIVSVTNFLMEHYNYLYDYSAIFNILVMISVFIFLFRIPTIDSIIMSVFSFAVVLVIQLLLIYIFTIFNNVTLKELRFEDAKYYIQIVSGMVFLLATWILNRNHWWFTFIPFKRTFKIKITRLNLGVLIAALSFIVLLSRFVNTGNLVMIIILSVVLFLTVLFFTIKKEKQYD